MPNQNIAAVPYRPRLSQPKVQPDGNARINLFTGGSGNLRLVRGPLHCHAGPRAAPPFLYEVKLPNGHQIWVKQQDAKHFPNHRMPSNTTPNVRFETGGDHRNSGGNLAVSVGLRNFDASSAPNAVHDTPVRMSDGKTLYMTFSDSLFYENALTKSQGHLDVFEDAPAANFVVGFFVGNGHVLSQARPFTVSIAVTGAAAIVSGVKSASYEARDLFAPPFTKPITVPNRGIVYVRPEDAIAFEKLLGANNNVAASLNQPAGPRGTSNVTVTLNPR
jgi:hypothetical protein